MIAPWVKARLSLPNDTSGGVNSRAASRASGASSNSSLSISHRKRKKKSISTSAMILSEKGESGADEENKETEGAQQEARSASNSERKPENGLKQAVGHISDCCVIQNLPEKVVVTDTGTDTEREETFSYLERSRPMPPLFKQEHVHDFDFSGQEFQCVSDRGRTLGAAFLFADAPVRRSLEEEWELEMARVARERRISTESALRRPSDPVKGKTSTAAHALLTWISRWRRRAFTCQPGQSVSRGRQESADAEAGGFEETERLFPTEAESSFSNTRAQKRYGLNVVSGQNTERVEPLPRSMHTPFRLEVSPGTPKSSLRQIGRQKTSIEDTAVTTNLELEKPRQGLLQVETSPCVHGGSDSTSSCLSLFDHVVCVHQADSPRRHEPPGSECLTVCANGHESSASRSNLKGSSTESINSEDKSCLSHIGNGLLPQNMWNKSDSHITKNTTHKFTDLFKFKKSQSLSSSKLKNSSKNIKHEDMTLMLGEEHLNCGTQDSSDSQKPSHSVGHCQNTFICSGLSSVSPNRSRSLPERLRKFFRSQDSSDDLLLEEFKPHCRAQIKRPFSFPVITHGRVFKKKNLDCKLQPDTSYHTKPTRSWIFNLDKTDTFTHTKYRPIQLTRQNSTEGKEDFVGELALENSDLRKQCSNDRNPSIPNHVNTTPIPNNVRVPTSPDPLCSKYSTKESQISETPLVEKEVNQNSRLVSNIASCQTDRTLDLEKFEGLVTDNCKLSSSNNHRLNTRKGSRFLGENVELMPTVGSHPSGIFRSFSDNGKIDSGRSQLGSRCPSNQMSLSTQYISVSSDLQNSDLYRRRMSPTRERSLRSSSKSAEVLQDTNPACKAGVRSLGKTTSAVTGVEGMQKATNGSNSTQNQCGYSITANRKGVEELDSPRTDSSSTSCYISAHESRSHDSASASYISCCSSVCSNNVFTYPSSKGYPQTPRRPNYSDKTDENTGFKHNQRAYDCDLDQETVTTISSKGAIHTESEADSPKCFESSISSHVESHSRGLPCQPLANSDCSVLKPCKNYHLFNNTTGCHALYSPPETPQDDSLQTHEQASHERELCALCQPPFCLLNSNHRGGLVKRQTCKGLQHQSNMIRPNHSIPSKTRISSSSHRPYPFPSSTCNLDHTSSRSSHKFPENCRSRCVHNNLSQTSHPEHCTDRDCLTKLHNTPPYPRTLLSSLWFMLPLFYQRPIPLDPRTCNVCSVFQIQNEALRGKNVTKLVSLVYNVNCSFIKSTPMLLLPWPILGCNPKDLFQTLHLNATIPHTCWSAGLHSDQASFSVSEDLVSLVLKSISNIHFSPVPRQHFCANSEIISSAVQTPNGLKYLDNQELFQWLPTPPGHVEVNSGATLLEDLQTETDSSVAVSLVDKQLRYLDYHLSKVILSGPKEVTNCLDREDYHRVSNFSCKLNTTDIFSTDHLPFHQHESMCLCQLNFLKIHPTFSHSNTPTMLLHCLPSWIHSIRRYTRKGILCWSVEKPITETFDLFTEQLHNIYQGVSIAVPITCQEMDFHNLHSDKTELVHDAIHSHTDSSTCQPHLSQTSDDKHSRSKQSRDNSITPPCLSLGTVDAIVTPAVGIHRVGDSKYSKEKKIHPESQLDSPEQKKRTWSLSKREGSIFKFCKPSAQPRSPRSEHGYVPLAGSPQVKRTSLRKKAVIAAGIRDSILGETILSHLSTAEPTNPDGQTGTDTSRQTSRQDGDRCQADLNHPGTGVPRVPPSSFPGGSFPPITAKTVHSALMKCVPTLACPEPVQSPSEQGMKYHPSACASASESYANTPTSAGSGTPSSTCEIFVRSVFDAFVTGNGFISTSEPCLPIFSQGNVIENGHHGNILPLDVPLTPLLARNDNRRRSASNRGGAEESEEQPGAGELTCEDSPPQANSGSECKLYQLARKNREALIGSTQTFTLGSAACMSPGASSTITATGPATDREVTDHRPRSRKQSTLSHSWFSLDDLESTRKPSRFRLRSFYYLNSLRHQIERAFSLGHIRSFLGLREADVRKKGRKVTRDTLAANQINVIITRCESIILDRSSEEVGGQPMRDRCKFATHRPKALQGVSHGVLLAHCHILIFYKVTLLAGNIFSVGF